MAIHPRAPVGLTMASMSTSCLFTPPQALARSKTRKNPSKTLKSSSDKREDRKRSKLYRHAKLESRGGDRLQAVTLSGGEATTYTRLPPKEDSLPSSSSLTDFGAEVRLSDSDVADFGAFAEKEVCDKGGEEEDDEEQDERDEDEIWADYNCGRNYRRLEVFEGNTGCDDEEELEEDYDSEYEDDALEYETGEIVNGYAIQNADEESRLDDGEIVDSSQGEGETGVKEKGVPAVMRCFDRAKIYVKAGDGGNGVVAFRREKFVPLGGPSGGTGGRGGNVYVEVDGSINSLLPFRNSVHFRAGRGGHGRGKMQDGAKGDDVVVKVAPGTVIREAGKEEVLLELLRPGQRALLLPGGKGGRGNASFKSGMKKVPKIAENGEEGPEMWLELELKLVADVGIVGAPNAGKSTFLSVISAAQPNISNYPFTTLLPNLGVVSFDYDSTMVVADLPGLLEGAHRGYGLGQEFLRHTERCSALVHVVDGSAPQPEFEFDAVRLELELFSPELAEKPFVVAYNKMDLPDAYEKWESFKERLQSRDIPLFCMSAVKREGTNEVICAAYELIRGNKQASRDFEGGTDPEDLNHVAERINRQRRASVNDFEITHDKSSKTWHVNGAGLQRFVQMTNWRYIDSEKRFQHVMEACGVNKSLMDLGVKEGDTVIVGGIEMVWHDAVDNAGPAGAKKGQEESTRWPQIN